MAKSKTYYAQVPVSQARKMAAEDANLPSPSSATCAICGRPVRLERCKVDESGNAVHETCYVSKILRRSSSPPERFELRLDQKT